LIATILSAQCTDARVNQVTETLFEKYRKAEDYLQVPEAELAADIKPTGFFNQKTRSVRGTCRKLVEEFGGEVPDTMEELITLPGVARKTANVVLGSAFGQAEGIVVDTHVGRIARRLGLTRHAEAVRAERDLVKVVPRDHWIGFSHRLIEHGRTICPARSPRCDECPLADLCPRVGVKPKPKPGRKSRRARKPAPRRPQAAGKRRRA
ncbi:MAG: endonuclease III, partial [Planctomycetia bacterium]